LSIACNDDFIVYHEKVLEGTRELKCTWMPVNKVDIDESYFAFKDVCKELNEMSEFKILEEVHEFFWHGPDSGWSF